MKVRFLSLASGSSGNCYYLGCDSYGILIDAGIGVRTIRKRLKMFGIPMESVVAVFVTHDHADHIKSLSVLGEQLFIPVYATPLTHKGINRSYCTVTKLQTCVRHIEKNVPVQLRNFTVEAFEVPHDGTDNVGYCISIGDRTFCFLTDLGEITDMAARYIARANHLIIEANYDDRMLDSGPYPAHLKARIRSHAGHLSNSDTARFLASHYTGKLQNIWLCHLSRENNTPEVALSAVTDSLKEAGIAVGRDVTVEPLKRSEPTGLYEFE